MIYAIVTLALIIAVVLAVVAFRSVDVLVRRQMRRQVVIELRGGETFRGLLVAVDARSVLLRSVEVLGSPQAETQVVDGELLIPRADIKFMQRP